MTLWLDQSKCSTYANKQMNDFLGLSAYMGTMVTMVFKGPHVRAD